MIIFEQLERRDVLSTFTLHSNPGADHTIYLDFDGHVTEGTPWNNVPCGCRDQIITPAYDTNGDPETFTAGELAAIEEMWARVAEDFIPFDVDVTTQEPGVDRLSNSGIGDTNWGQRIVIGGSSWAGSSGGISYFNSFAWNSDTPAFVFEDNFSGGFGVKSIAEAATHETGHTLGLGHDGSSTTSYYAGHGSGETGWAPIMGLPYLRDLTQWSKGEYPDANQQQDDLAIITTQNGFGYRADDHGDRRNRATSFTGLASGIITTSVDVDYFAFSTSGGFVTLNVNPAAIGPNLDVGIRLFKNGKLIAEANPVNDLSASLSVTVGRGTYYVEIDGVGRPDTGDGHLGYSDYGSLGAYTLSGEVEGQQLKRRVFGRGLD